MKKSPMTLEKLALTVEKLARTVTAGFSANKKQFDKADAKLNHEIGNLAAVVKRGFDHVEEQFAEVDKRFEEVAERFEGVDRRLDGIDGRLQHLGNRLDTVVTHERRITRIEKKVGIPTAD